MTTSFKPFFLSLRPASPTANSPATAIQIHLVTARESYSTRKLLSGQKKVFREYLTRVAMPSLYRYSRRGGSSDAVGSERNTRLNDPVKVSTAYSAEHQSANLTIWVRFPAETLIFLRLIFTALRVSVTSSHSLINPHSIICFSQIWLLIQSIN